MSQPGDPSLLSPQCKWQLHPGWSAAGTQVSMVAPCPGHWEKDLLGFQESWACATLEHPAHYLLLGWAPCYLWGLSHSSQGMKLSQAWRWSLVPW